MTTDNESKKPTKIEVIGYGSMLYYGYLSTSQVSNIYSLNDDELHELHESCEVGCFVGLDADIWQLKIDGKVICKKNDALSKKVDMRISEAHINFQTNKRGQNIFLKTSSEKGDWVSQEIFDFDIKKLVGEFKFIYINGKLERDLLQFYYDGELLGIEEVMTCDVTYEVIDKSGSRQEVN